jgi:hypothetical protein
VGGNEQDVVESERLLDDAHSGKPSSQNEIIPMPPFPNKSGTTAWNGGIGRVSLTFASILAKVR